MCLQSKWIFPRKATKDIVCYKVLIKNSNGDLITPFQMFPIGNIKELPIIVEGGKHKSINRNIENIKSYYKHSKNIIYSIMLELKCKEEGYIHAYTNLYDAELDLSCGHKKYIIVKCIIPKSIPYHISFGGYTICTRKMIILKEII